MSDAPAPRHASTEQLSAHLDGRVDAAEVTFVSEHLPVCAQCAEELSGLAAVRDLLGRLPVEQPPRSFLLPATVTPREPARVVRFPLLTTMTRAASAVAAAFFVLFFTADMAGFGDQRPLPMSGGLSPGNMTTSPAAPVPGVAGAPAPAAAPAQPLATQQPAAKVDSRVAPTPPPADAAKPAPAPPRAESKPAESAARADQVPATVVSTAPAAAYAVPPTPVLRPPTRSVGEAPTADGGAAADAASQSGARDQTSGDSGQNRARLGAMASTVNRLAGSPSPLRWSWIGTGVLAVILLLGSVIVGRRRGR